MLQQLTSLFAGRMPTPPVHASFALAVPIDEPDEAPALDPANELHPVSGFTCVIDYSDASGEVSQRLITCRTFEKRGERISICGICHHRKAYRRFILDRIEAVYDPTTGEQIGDGQYFARFSLDVDAAGAETWGLTSSRKATLLAGLNILAFMARCDGEWHPLEEPVFADFVDRFWTLKGWPGEPPICSIMDHVRNLAPDEETFTKAARHLGRSDGSTALILDATRELIEADGVIAIEEFDWCLELKAALADSTS